MPSIYIHIDAVRMVRSDTGRQTVKLMNARMGTTAAGSGVDYQIRTRRSIDSRLSSVYRRLESAERRMKELDAFLENSSLGYDRTEERLVQEARNVKAPWRDAPWWKEQIVDPLVLINRVVRPGLELLKEFNDYRGLNIRFYKENGKMIIKILQGDLTYNQFKAMLTDRLGTVSAWSRGFTNRLNSTGVSLYDFSTNRPNTRYTNFFGNTNLDDLNRYVHNLGTSKWTVFRSTFKENWLEEAKRWNDYKGWVNATKMAKAFKGAGIAGDVLMVASNFSDCFYNSRTGEMEYTGEAVKKFVVDTAVDVGASAAAIATGAAVGSLIVPPVGTVVGAGVGFGVNWAMNYEFGGPPPKSVVGHTKDAVNSAVDWTSDVIDNIGSRLASVFW
ncbi:hypothetical protein [Cohnella cellulosilytica]|uniref:WXG100 family type VII secretion target n=1 Tax=Cohnella cellulosilytica TaxID=986710 RepID=A0ABW2F217_9BACL